MKKYFLILILIYSCDTQNDSVEKIQFQDKEYSEAFQLIEYWLDAQKDYEKLPGLTAVITDSGLALLDCQTVRIK